MTPNAVTCWICDALKEVEGDHETTDIIGIVARSPETGSSSLMHRFEVSQLPRQIVYEALIAVCRRDDDGVVVVVVAIRQMSIPCKTALAERRVARQRLWSEPTVPYFT